MKNHTDAFDLLFETYFKNKNENVVRITSTIGIAIARVLNTILLETIKKEFDNSTLEMEFSYIRDKHLSFKPVKPNFAISTGILYVRIQGVILQYVVKVVDYCVDREDETTFYIEAIHENEGEYGFITNLKDTQEEFSQKLATYLFLSFERFVETL